MEKLVIIDGNSLINRAFYATPPLANKDGVITNAVYGFTNMLLLMIGQINPEYIAVAFDMRAKTFRHKLYDGYKASRKGMPDELASQLPLLKEVLTSMDINIIEREGFEADDLIGALSKAFDGQSIIITGDRDSLQLIDSKTVVHLTKRGISDVEIVDEAVLKEKFQLTPAQVIDYKALCGDSSDEIPGVKGIGDKTAKQLIALYGNLDNIYENIENIKGSVKDKLINNKEMAYLSKTLATIERECLECDFNIEDFRYTYPLTQKVRDVFTKLAFNNILQKQHLFSNSETENVIEKPKAQEINIVNISDILSFDSAVSSALSSESCSLLLAQDKISFYFGENEYQVVISDTFLMESINLDRAIEALKPLLLNEKTTKILFDYKSNKHFLKAFNVDVLGKVEDVCLMQYIVNSTINAYDFKKICSYYGYSDKTPAYSLYEIANEIISTIKSQGFEKLYYELELPLVNVLYSMEIEGFKIDLKVLEELSNRFKTELDELKLSIYSLCGEEFNINSPKQLAYILFEKLELKSSKKNKSGMSTDIDVLESLENKHAVVPLVIRYRQISKLYSTYIEGMRNVVDKDGFVHTIFKQALTTTGRLSSTEPNLQNIPVRDEEGREIRKMFCASRQDSFLICADYSQIELRLLAHFSRDTRLVSAFLSSEDIHTITAADVFNVDKNINGEGGVTSEMRRSAKAVNFGIIYGISSFGLAKQLNIAPSRAKVYIEKYFETYSSVKDYMNSNVEFAKQNGYSLTLTGRKRYIAELKSPNFNVRSFGERAAMNMPLQGSAADIIKIAMLNVYNELKSRNLKSRLILQVHDELIIDTYMEEKDIVIEILKRNMENAYSLNVPLSVGVGVGHNWYDAK